MKKVFRRIANRMSNWAGSAFVFLGAAFLVIVWASTGPVFHFSDTWQLVINTGTTIVTFLMVFLIQNTQNRDTKAMQLKLDELIHVTKGARSHFVGLEDLSDEELKELDNEFKKLNANGNTARALARLQEKIALEHKRRLNLLQISRQAGSAVLGHFRRNDKLKTKPTEPIE